MIVNINILGLLEYLHRTIEAMTMVPRTDGTSARELNIYTSNKIVFEDRTPGCKGFPADVIGFLLIKPNNFYRTAVIWATQCYTFEKRYFYKVFRSHGMVSR